MKRHQDSSAKAGDLAIRRWTTLTVSVVVFLFCSQASAQAPSYDSLTPPETVENHLVCLRAAQCEHRQYSYGVLRGVWFVLMTNAKEDSEANMRICFKGDVPMVDLRQIFVSWAKRNSPFWHLHGPAGMIAAFVDEWPCK